MNQLTTSTLKYSLIALLAATQITAFAEASNDTSSNKAELEKMHKEAKQQAGAQATGEQDADDVITNKKLRAESGSKSKYSISTALNYNGSTLEKPFNERRPNITNGAALDNVASIAGTIAAKYNINATNSLSAGFGLKVNTPFSESVPQGAGQRITASDPSLTYQKLSKIGGVQSVTLFGPTLYTSKNVRADGTQGDMTLQQIFAYDFGGSKFTLGGLLQASGRTFDKSASTVCGATDAGDPVFCGQSQSDYTLGAYPFAEYQFNDTFGVRTITGLYVYDHYRSESRAMTFSKNVIYQSVGLGISLTRDVYLYPNIQFIPEDIRSDRTNVALSTNINLF